MLGSFLPKQSVVPYRGTKVNNLRFAVKVLLIVLSVVALLWVIGLLFSVSRLAGYCAVGVVAVGLYLTVQRWIRWLPGILIFGVLNAFIGLVTQHVPSNPRVAVAPSVALLLLAFYAAGYLASSFYDAARLSPLDRCAVIFYLLCAVLPALFGRNDVSTLRPAIVWPVTMGVLALTISLASHRLRKESAPNRV